MSSLRQQKYEVRELENITGHHEEVFESLEEL